MKNAFGLLLVLGLAACDGSTTAPTTSPEFSVVAVTTFEGNKPALFTQRVDGSQKTRISFTNVRDDIPGNYSGLTVGDASLLALSNPSWDPTGFRRRVAVVATLAYDQSQIVVMNTDGSGGEVASVNTQIIVGTPAWSPDGKKLAYVMATLPGLTGLDLFVTDLATHTVKRVTTNANLTNTVVRWYFDSQHIMYAKVTGATTDNERTDIVKINANTGASETFASAIPGAVTSISRFGALLLTRNTSVGGRPTRSLVHRDPTGREDVLVDADVTYANFNATTETHALLVSATTSGSSTTRSYAMVNIATKERMTLAGLAGEANADIWTPYPLD